MRFLALLLLLVINAHALDKAGAEAAVARGWDALGQSDSDPKKSVDAALAFTEALNYYRTTDDGDTCRELQANIFWCKKRMNLGDLKTYVAAKGHESAPALVVVMDEVTEKKLDEGEADKYFGNVQKFAKSHPSDHLKIAIQYFEVASRFPGTQVATDAQRLSLSEQVQVKGGAKTTKTTLDATASGKMKDVKIDMVDFTNVDREENRGRWVASTNGTGNGAASASTDNNLATNYTSPKGCFNMTWKNDRPTPITTVAIIGRWDANDDKVIEGELFLNDVSIGKYGEWANNKAIVVTLPSPVTVKSIKLVIGAGRNNPGVSEMYAR